MQGQQARHGTAWHGTAWHRTLAVCCALLIAAGQTAKQPLPSACSSVGGKIVKVSMFLKTQEFQGKIKIRASKVKLQHHSPDGQWLWLPGWLVPWRVAVPRLPRGAGVGGDEAGGASSAALGSAHTAGTLPREGGTCCCGARQRCGFVGIKALFGADSIPPTAALLCAVSESSKQLWKQHLGQSLPCAPSQAPPCCCPSRGAPKQPSRPPRITSAQWVSPQFSLRANLGVLGGFVLHFRFFS